MAYNIHNYVLYFEKFCGGWYVVVMSCHSLGQTFIVPYTSSVWSFDDLFCSYMAMKLY
jgi:hypothetical protein